MPMLRAEVADESGLVPSMLVGCLMGQSVWIPDESGMGGEDIPLGVPHWDYDSRRWLVQLDRFVARPATIEEIRDLPSPPGRRLSSSAGRAYPAGFAGHNNARGRS